MSARTTWATLILAAATTAWAAPTFLLSLGLRVEDLEEAVGRPVEQLVPLESLSPLKAVPVHKRADVVHQLAQWANTYVASGDFKKRYASVRAQALPARPSGPRDMDDVLAQLDRDHANTVQQARDGMRNLPRAQRVDAEQRLKEMEEQYRRSRADMAAQAGALRAAEQQRYEAETAAYQAAVTELNTRLPADGRAWLRKGLERFVLETHNVQFGARVNTADGYTTFEKDELEAKPAVWKACFRAGRGACEAAREEALAWLKANPGK